LEYVRLLFGFIDGRKLKMKRLQNIKVCPNCGYKMPLHLKGFECPICHASLVVKVVVVKEKVRPK
jgi:ribosomal protein S27AE